MLRLLFMGLFILSCIVETQDALFTGGRTFQEFVDDMIEKAIKKVSKKLQDKLDVLKDNKYAIKIWKYYKKYYKKNYTSPDEEHERFGKFIDNLKIIIQENSRFDDGVKSFKLSLNQFGDMSLEEFRQKLTGLNTDGQGEIAPTQIVEEQVNERTKRFLLDSLERRVDKLKKKLKPGKKRPSDSGMYHQPGSPSGGTRLNPSAKRPFSSLGTDRTVDYRSFMNPVENQGRCGSCYAFAVTAAIEGTFSVKKNSRIKLSKQQLVDCSSSNNGCSGGYLGKTFEYIKLRGGLEPDTSYPYKSSRQTCSLRSSKVGAIKGFGNVGGNEEAMKQAVRKYGPLAAAVHTTSDLQFYTASKGGRSSDILDINYCSKQVDHAITIVGYGTDNGKDYWLVRNSWGSNWGLAGYFKIARNKNNMCGIATYGYFTEV